MMLGSNDRQSIRVERESVDPDNERWRGLYAERVDQVMQVMKARGVPGLLGRRAAAARPANLGPTCSSSTPSTRSGPSATASVFVDVWNGFIDEHGAYTQFGPDFAGQVRRLRTADGVHFTVAGARKLALFLEQDLRRDLLGRITPALPSGGTDPAGQPQAAPARCARPRRAPARPPDPC
jgi:hypothetical protein